MHCSVPLISFCLIIQVCEEQTVSILWRRSGISAISGATHRYCVSVRELADKWRCLLLDPWRPAVECHSALWVERFVSGAERRLSGRMVMIAKDKTSLSALCSNLTPILISFSCPIVFWGNKSSKNKRNKLACMALLYYLFLQPWQFQHSLLDLIFRDNL